MLAVLGAEVIHLEAIQRPDGMRMTGGALIGHVPTWWEYSHIILSANTNKRGLTLNLVHNPVGAFLPAKQEAIEAQYRRELERAHGVVFNRLYTITNMPISRFLEFLLDSGNYEGYDVFVR